MTQASGENGNVDVLISGGGVVGLSLALALRKADSELGVAVVERSRSAGRDDGRASAIAAAARHIFSALGVWDEIISVAQPIHEMIVTDSRADDVSRPIFLTFDGTLADGEPFAHMVPNAALQSVLVDAALAAGVEFIRPASVTRFSVNVGKVEVEVDSGRQRLASLLVAADGSRSSLREQAGIKTLRWDYPQSGIVATISHQRPHNGRAEEHFLPSGPFAVLPLRGNRSSLVWTESRSKAEDLSGSDNPSLSREIEQRIGYHLGSIEIEGPVQTFPLGLRVAREFVRPRFCLVGDAAHFIHPLAGQGLNLGLRDVAALAETIIETRRLGLDIGAADQLERYQRWRRFDTAEMSLLTDGLNRLFSNDNPVIRLARDIGLGLVDRMPSLKSLMINQAAGQGNEIPRLLKGEAI